MATAIASGPAVRVVLDCAEAMLVGVAEAMLVGVAEAGRQVGEEVLDKALGEEVLDKALGEEVLRGSAAYMVEAATPALKDEG
jgi:hypothetical protein